MTEPIYITIEGGCYTGAVIANGDIAPVPVRLIDFDNLEHGMCPVCGEECKNFGAKVVKQNGVKYSTGGRWVCESCGYDESLDNALECAVKYHAEDNKEVTE